MIEKLSEYKITSRDGSFINVECNTKIINTLVRKINELVDVINKQQDIIRQIGEWGSSKGECLWCDTLTEFNPKKPTISKMENVDPYAEQRRWIGKLCWFWDDEYYLKTAGVLEELSPTEGDYMYAKRGTLTVWKHCEPVKPDDDIIYKGGKDE